MDNMTEQQPKNYVSLWALVILWVGIYVLAYPVHMSFKAACQGLIPGEPLPNLWNFFDDIVYGNFLRGILVVCIASLLCVVLSHRIVRRVKSEARRLDLLILIHIASGLFMASFVAALATSVAVLFVPSCNLRGQTGGLIPYHMKTDKGQEDDVPDGTDP